MSVIVTAQGRVGRRNYDQGLTDRQNKLFGAYQIRQSEQRLIESGIYERLVLSYQNAIRGELGRAGCSTVVNEPSGSDANALRQIAETKATQITNTHNESLRRQVIAITQDRAVTLDQAKSQLKAWADSRLSNRNNLILTDVAGDGAAYGRQRFAEQNNYLQASVIWDASPPLLPNSHPECKRRVRLGRFRKVTFEEAKGWTRTHPNCRHRIKFVDTPSINCNTVWRG